MPDDKYQFIERFLNCPDCYKEKPDDVSMLEFSNLSVGVDIAGNLIIVCHRHSSIMRVTNANLSDFMQKAAGLKCGNPDHQGSEETVH